ncbi:hypothetical protein M1328_00655 [Patescibacteria group bacterium]|nr:hypothetical protein [Patescibacteria group bacterium]
MSPNIFNKQLKIIAGPCSIDENNVEDVMEIAEIKVKNSSGKNRPAIFGTRVVGLKSRTALSRDGKNMGIDFQVYKKNMEAFMAGQPVDRFKLLPSVKIAKQIIKKTKLLVASEIMDPLFQLPVFEKNLPREKVMVWNPAVSQLGWPIMNMAHFARKNRWMVGLKNPKWYGDEHLGQTTMEKTWIGLVHYTEMNQPGFEDKLVLIHRGVDVYNKGDYRNLPVHQAAQRVKKSTRAKLFFVPCKLMPPKLRDAIVSASVEAMKIKIDEENFLYDGILIEVGRSKTDTEQHVTVKELADLCQRLAEFRSLTPPN